MSRRNRSQSISFSWLLLVIPLLALGGVGAFLLIQGGDPYRTTERLQPRNYLENSNSLRGNTYKLEGVILNSLGWSPQTGRLFSLRTADDDGAFPLPILVPSDYRDLNIQKGQRYQIKVKVNEAGLLEVEEMTKS